MIVFFEKEIVLNNWQNIQAGYKTMIAVAQLLPGPFGIDAAVYIGYNVAGVPGVLIAVFAISLPSFLAIILIMKNYHKFKTNKYLQIYLDCLKPVVIALLLAAVYIVFPDKNVFSILHNESLTLAKASLICITGYLLLLKTKISSLVYFFLFAIFGIILF